jgi:hypothetical protein
MGQNPPLVDYIYRRRLSEKRPKIGCGFSDMKYEVKKTDTG